MQQMLSTFTHRFPGGSAWLCTELPSKHSNCNLSDFQVGHQPQSASRGLEQLLQDFSCQGHALAQVTREKELLGHERAALEARVAAMEQDVQGLSEQLAEAR